MLIQNYLVYESINNSDFSYTARFKGKETASGIDIEPFGWDSAPYRFCKEIHFNNCHANYNTWGAGFRFERVIGGSIRNCEVMFNQNGINLLECNTGNEDKIWGIHNTESDRNFYRNRIIIEGNTFKNNGITINSSSESMAVITNNFIQNTSCIISGSIRNTHVFDNIIFNTGYVFTLSGIIDDFQFKNNRVTGINCPEHDTAIFSIFQWEVGSYCHHVEVKNNVFKYAGGQTIYGSNDSQPMPYPSVKDYLFYVQGSDLKKIEFIDNHFDDELWAPFDLAATYTVYGDWPIVQQRTFTPEDLQRTKHLMKGDIIDDYGQKGLITRGRWLGQVGTPFANSTQYYQNQIVYDGIWDVYCYFFRFGSWVF